MTMIGHNNPPKDRGFKKRWAAAIFAHPDKPAGAVALAFKLFSEMDATGRGAVISDAEFCQSCGVSKRACQNFKGWLIEEGFIHVHVRGYRGSASEIVAHIPAHLIDAPDAPSHEMEPDAPHAPNQRQLSANSAPSHREIDAQRAPSAQKSEISPAPARAEDINNIYNNINNLKTHTTTTRQTAARDFNQLHDTLVGACNGALDNPVNCQGLLNLGIPIMWLNEGCDLEADILPTLRAFGKSHHGRRIKSWAYFSGAIAKARDARREGLPPPTAQPAAKRSPKQIPLEPGESFSSVTKEFFEKIKRGENPDGI